MFTLRIATRQSELALWQANYVGNLLKHFWPEINIQLVPMLTSGDKFLVNNLAALGGKGLFIKELEEALLAKKADIAVHSMKDVPPLLVPGLELAVICERENPFDAVIGECTFQQLDSGAIVGTSSLRRQSQILALRADLRVKPLRGNINSRLLKLQRGEFTAIILAVAGLKRLNLTNSISEILSAEIMLPSCGQGALGIECRADDKDIRQFIAPLHDLKTALCVETERYVSKILGGSCQAPLAIFAELVEDNLFLQAKVLSRDGQIIISDQQIGHRNDALLLADLCAKSLLSQGAAALLGNDYQEQ